MVHTVLIICLFHLIVTFPFPGVFPFRDPSKETVLMFWLYVPTIIIAL